MTRPSLPLVPLAFALVLAWPLAAHAETACPSRTAVERAVAELASRGREGPVFDEQARRSLELDDVGASFRVKLANREREYADPERDCERRARLAAVFIALVLTGEDASEAAPRAPEESKPAAPAAVTPKPALPPTRSTPSQTSPRPHRAFIVDAAARVALATSESRLVVLPGAELGASFMPGELGVHVAAAAPFSEGTLAVGPARAHLARYPLTVALRWRRDLDPIAVAIDAGAETALLRVARDDGSHANTRFDFAGRLGVSVAIASLPVSPMLSAFTEVVPLRFPLALEPDGPITKTPLIWFGATAGASVAF